MPKTTLIDCCIKKYAYREVSQIYQELEISGEGLSQSQVELMREKYGVNSFSQRRNDTMLRLLRRAFINPFNIILLVLGIISLATDVVLVSNFARNATTAVIIFSMILISGTIRLVQELRAKNASKQLNRLIHESITVRRAGEVKEIPAEELVVGDIVLLVCTTDRCFLSQYHAVPHRVDHSSRVLPVRTMQSVAWKCWCRSVSVGV